ncbi:HVO_0649 family zinc finger protein [Halogeometricum limi]|uniref:Small CPxCG-related zinc finger protein n=1 Tax=Halogeometricum limi TaxID=555875 RepID=A0A1I6G417_9EURY|nr:HVO_0649 family zinc finger protein [Halogeometricum limi]SFR36944.1 hypothetical protein SAMN04488124_0837 [Halogeometricum limi]
MAVKGSLGGTPFDRLRERYDRTQMRCKECGFHDTEGGWTAATTGSKVTYEHTCPSCGYVDSVVITT